jgi:hypothetical protein
MDRNTLILVLIAALILLAVLSEAMKAFERAERQLDEESKKNAPSDSTGEEDDDE